MAYKFQSMDAILSGTIAPANDNYFDLGVAGAEWKDVHLDGTLYAASSSYIGATAHLNGASTFASTIAASGSITAGTSFVIGSADLNETDMEKLDGITNGTAAAAKAVVLDASKNIATLGTVGCGAITSTGASTMGSLNIGGTLACDTSFTLDAVVINATELGFIDGVTAGTAAASKAVVLGASSEIATIGTVGCGAITSTGNSSMVQLTTSGRVIVDDATEATTTTDGSLQTDGGLSVAKSAVVGDDLDLLSDAAVLNFGADKDVSLTHVADTGLLLNSTMAIQFNDASQYIKASSAADLDLAATTDINMDCTTVDINGALDVSGVATFQTGLIPDATNGAYLGTTNAQWSDLFLGTGAVINFDNGDVTMTHSNDLVTIAGSNSPTLTATLTNALTQAANSGLSGGTYNGSAAVAVALDLNDLSAAAVDVGADSIAIIDANDSNGSRKESIADLVSAMAGAGLTATNGVLASDASPTPNDMGDAAGNLVEGFNFTAAAFTGARVWTLPASPDAGDVVGVKAPPNAGLFALTVSKSGSQTIDGMDTVIIGSDNGAVEFVYLGSDKWAIK